MKKKFSKVFGVGLTVALLASLLLAAAPVAADPGTLAWSTVDTPNPIYQQLQEGSDVDFLLVAPDGETMFAFDNGVRLWKSTDAGLNWTRTNVDTGTTTYLHGKDLVGMAISPDYADDSTVVAATEDAVYLSTDGGKTFGEVPGFDTTSGVTGNLNITSIDVATYYLGGLAILVGTADTITTTSVYGGAYLYTISSLAWSDLSVDVTGTTATGNFDVLAVAFSPNHRSDAQVLAVVTDESKVYVTSKLLTDSYWAESIDAATIATWTTAVTDVPTSACMAFPADYEYSSMNQILVGVAGETTDTYDDVWRVESGLYGAGSTAYDLNVLGSTNHCEVHSIAIKGDMAGADVLVGRTDNMTVKRTSDPTTSTVTWSSSTKAPTGGTNVLVVWSPTTDDAYAATAGADSALSRSSDGGVTWNQIALIDVSSLSSPYTALTIDSSAIVDADTMFLIMADGGGKESLFKTTNGGTNWERIWAREGLAILALSPDYATDETLYITEGSRLWRTTNGGETFSAITKPKPITALAIVDTDTYFTGHADRIYKSGEFTYATITGTAKSIALSPNYAEDDTLFVGNNDGDVFISTDDGDTFTCLGADDGLGSGATVVVTCDPDYATNSTIYGGSSTKTVGVNRWVIDTSTVWKQLDDDGNTLECTGIALSEDGVLYAANDYATTEKGIRRILYPKSTIVTAAKIMPDSMTEDLPTGSQLKSVACVPGSNVLYAISGNIAPGTYKYAFRLLAFTDILAVAPTLTAPDDGASVGTRVTLSWEAITTATTLTYEYDVATDADFANIVSTATGDTEGSSISVSGLTEGVKYWWRIYASSPLSSLVSERTFYVVLGVPDVGADYGAPTPGATGVAISPVFTWKAVDGATRGYELELADNALFTGATSKTLDTNVWECDITLDYSTTYYWRVKSLSDTTESDWANGVFKTVAEEAVVYTCPQCGLTFDTEAELEAHIAEAHAPVVPETPGYIWAIIAIGAILMVAVLVLIFRTRRIA